MEIIELRERKVLKVKLDGRKKIGEVLKEIGILPSLYVILRNGKIITEEDVVEEEDKIELFPVTKFRLRYFL